jgi:C-terminal processing protease CtpA/Prc
VLSRFKVIFDFSAEKVYLQKNRSFRKKFYYNLSGLTVKATGKNMDKFEISDVREKSPSFNAGLLVGDFIQKINGFPSNVLNLNQVNDFFNSAPRRRLYIEIIRKGELLKKEFRLEDPI